MDRTEISILQEMIVKSQASLSKIKQQNKERESLEVVDMVTKAEIEHLLDKKVNKTDFQSQIDNLVKSIKKNRKLAALSGGKKKHSILQFLLKQLFVVLFILIGSNYLIYWFIYLLFLLF